MTALKKRNTKSEKSQIKRNGMGTSPSSRYRAKSQRSPKLQSRQRDSQTSTFMPVGQLIKLYREERGLTQRQLAELLGYDIPQFVSLIENGHSKIPLNILGRVVEHLKIPENLILNSLLQTYEQEIREKLKGTEAS